MKWNILVIRGKKNKKKYFVSTGEGKWKKKMKIFGAILYEIINEIKTSSFYLRSKKVIDLYNL